MSWSAILIAGVGIVYAGTAAIQYYDGKTALAITFFAYALANVGLYLQDIGWK